jgi:uncharacterized protein
MRTVVVSAARRAMGAAGGLVVVIGALAPVSHAVAATGDELFISEYVEGSATNQAIEIFNPTDTPMSLSASGYRLEFYGDGSTAVTGGVLLIGVIQPGGTWVVVPTDASDALKAKANQTFNTSAFWFDGNDAVALTHSGSAIDIIGQIGFDPGEEWGSGLTGTRDHTLRRKAGITAGDTDGTDAFDPSVEWDGFPMDTFDGFGSVGSPPVNEPVSIACPTELSTTQPVDATGAVSASDPDGTVASLSVTSVTPSDPGTISVTGVTPASSVGGSATGTLTVSGSTSPGSYAVTVTATNDDASPQTADCTVAVSVAPFVSAFDKLRTMVSDLTVDGGVNPSKAFLLTNRLDRAAADQAAGRMSSFQAQMQAFGNQVAGLSPRWITPSAAARLQAGAAAAAAEAG